MPCGTPSSWRGSPGPVPAPLGRKGRALWGARRAPACPGPGGHRGRIPPRGRPGAASFLGAPVGPRGRREHVVPGPWGHPRAGPVVPAVAFHAPTGPHREGTATFVARCAAGGPQKLPCPVSKACPAAGAKRTAANRRYAIVVGPSAVSKVAADAAFPPQSATVAVQVIDLGALAFRVGLEARSPGTAGHRRALPEPPVWRWRTQRLPPPWDAASGRLPCPQPLGSGETVGDPGGVRGRGWG